MNVTVRAALLATLPLTGRRVREYRLDDIREVLDRPYRLIYRVTRERIEILTVKHYRQRLSERHCDL